jgi:hypothetical protein
MLQDASVVMLGVRNPAEIPKTVLYVPKDSLAQGLVYSVAEVMADRWQVRPLTVKTQEEVDESWVTGKASENADDSFAVRIGDYASAIVKRLDLQPIELRTAVRDLERRIFAQGVRYLTIEIDISDLASLSWQVVLEEEGFVPTRFWPPIAPDQKPNIRYGKIHPGVKEVVEMDLPSDLKDFPNAKSLTEVVAIFQEIGDRLFKDKKRVMVSI